MSAAERADRVNCRLTNLIIRATAVQPFSQNEIVTRPSETIITLGGEPILSITDEDAREALSTRDGLALLWGAKMRELVAILSTLGLEGGTVEPIELKALYLRTYDNRLVIIPNGDVFTSTVTSNTASPLRRRDFVIEIGYDEDIDRAREVALNAVQSVEGVAELPAPDVLIDDLTALTVNLRIRFFTHSQRADYIQVGSECMRRVKEAFRREKIAIGKA